MNYEAVVIGGSAGGINALQTILAPLPADFRWPILVVLHRLAAPDELLTLMLSESCQFNVKEAEPYENIKPGQVYIAPANYHLLVEGDKTLSLSIDAKVCHSRPSIDVLFETASDAYRSSLIGIILTGANSDGTAGLRKIKAQGGLTMAQDPATATAKIMPNSAIQENVVDQICSLTEISSFLTRLSSQGMHHE